MKRTPHIFTWLLCTLFTVQATAQVQLPNRRGNTQSTTTTPSTRATNTAPPVRATTPQTQGQTANPTNTTNTGTPQVQPRARQAQTPPRSESSTGASIRAQTQYNAQREVPSDLVWKRELYRSIDLEKEENAGLLDPITPIGNRMNLFTMIFKLLADKEIQAYEYTLDGEEHFDDAHKIDFMDVLNRFEIPFGRKRIGGTTDTVFVVDNSDIPSQEALTYFIKEVWYYDQNNASFHTGVTALCPVLHRTGDFDLNIQKYPLFWIKVSDLAPYMNRIHIPTSAYNNAATMSLDDFFSMRMYDGEIYKTNNPSGRTLAQTADSDSTLIKERQLIESQLETVEENLWSTQIVEEDTDATEETGKKSKATANSTTESTDNDKNTRRKNESQNVKSGSSSSSSAPKASVRRERR